MEIVVLCSLIMSLFFCFQKKWQQASAVLLPLPSVFLWQCYGTVDLERQSLHVVIREALSLSTLLPSLVLLRIMCGLMTV
jgi:hypothetical protein